MDQFKKLEELQNSEEFVKALETIETPEQLQELFLKHGVEVTMDEIREMSAYACSKSSDELSETDLEDVAGGGFFGWVGKTVVTWFAKKGLDWVWSKIKK